MGLGSIPGRLLLKLPPCLVFQGFPSNPTAPVHCDNTAGNQYNSDGVSDDILTSLQGNERFERMECVLSESDSKYDLFRGHCLYSFDTKLLGRVWIPISIHCLDRSYGMSFWPSFHSVAVLGAR